MFKTFMLDSKFKIVNSKFFCKNMEPIEEKDLNLEDKFKFPGKEAASEKGDVFKVEKEIAQEVAGAEKDGAYQDVLAKIKTDDGAQIDPVAVASDAAHLNTIDPETHVQHLVDIALQKGTVHAIKVAMHMDDNYILDMFHDRLLSEQLHEALVKNGMLKEI